MRKPTYYAIVGLLALGAILSNALAQADDSHHHSHGPKNPGAYTRDVGQGREAERHDPGLMQAQEAKNPGAYARDAERGREAERLKRQKEGR